MGSAAISWHATAVAGALLLAAACSPRGEGTSVEDAVPPIVQSSDAPTETEPGSGLEPKGAPEPAPAPESPPPEPPKPPELHLVRYDCRALGLSIVESEVFLHYDDAQAIGTIDRMDPRGGVAQSLRFTEDLEHDIHSFDDPIIEDIRGRWPDQLYVLAGYDSRVHYFRGLFRRVGKGWRQIGRPGEAIDYVAVWPWSDRSILALVNDVDADMGDTTSFPRFAVIRGEAKPPWLGAVKRRGKCEPFDFNVTDLHLGQDGSVTALVDCGRMWLSTWAPGKREATVRALAPNDASGRLLLGGDGQGFIAFDSALVQWRDGAQQPVSLPDGGDLDEVDPGPGGEPWIRQGDVVSRWTEDGWQRAMELPPQPRIWALDGLDRGTPWGKREGGTLTMQTADGQWHPVSMPPTSDRDDPPSAREVYFVGEDVWVIAGYYRRNQSSKFFGTEIKAVYTTLPAEAPAQCGWAPAPS